MNNNNKIDYYNMDYKYPISEIIGARIAKNHSEMKMYLKELKRLHQGVGKKTNWHVENKQWNNIPFFNAICCEKSGDDGYYIAKRDQRRKK